MKILKWCTTLTILLGYFLTINGKQFQCKNSRNCSCTPVQSKYEIQCPFDNPLITLIINLENDVKIQCTNLTEWDLNFLPALNIGKVEHTEMSMCPLPKTFIEIMNHFGINQTKTFRFDYSTAFQNTSVSRKYFDKMADLESILLDANDITSIENDVFKDMPKLIEIDLKSNKITPNSELFRYTPNLEILDLARNDIVHLSGDIFTNMPKLKILHLWTNNLTTLEPEIFNSVTHLASLDLSFNKIQRLPDKVFYPLTNLKELNLIGNNLTDIPINVFVKNDALIKVRLGRNTLLDTLPEELFANLPNLISVYLCENRLKNIPGSLFSNSSKLENISIQKNKLEYVPEKLFANLVELKELDLSYNEITSLPDEIFSSLKNLTVLNLGYNKINTISVNLLSQLINLRELNFQNNLLTRIGSMVFLRNENLVKIDFSYNNLDFMEYNDDLPFAISPFNSLTKLEDMYLNNNNISNFLDDWTLNKVVLKNINLSNNQIKYISFDSLQKVSKHRVIINLKHNMITIVDLSNAEVSARNQDGLDAYSSNSDYHSVVLLGDNPITCDCGAYNLVRYFEGSIDPRVLTLLELVPDGLTCAEPPNFKDKPVQEVRTKQLTCTLQQLIDNSTVCPEKCDCAFRFYDKAFIVDCRHRNLTSVPKIILPSENYYNQTEIHLQGNFLTSAPKEDMGYENVTRLYLSDNKITQIEWVPPKIEILQLENNNISGLNYEILSILNASTTLVNISLHNNPWTCDCSAVNFTTFLREHLVLKQVNANNITCKGEKTLLVNLNMKDLCPNTMLLVYAIAIPILLLAFIIATLSALYYRYHQEVKVWLFAHNLCLWFVTEEEIDKDKIYDAFVSFSQKDEDFVVNELLPKLEQGPKPYKLCIHIRDWIPGEFITEQIAKSVEDSRRTLVVLSPSFLESVWGKMEFRTAHTQAMKEKRARVIIVLFGEIDLNMDLDEELKAYINTNTYVKWGDPWFWDKLRYALPHSNLKKEKRQQRNNNIMISLNDKLDLMNAPVTPNLGTTPPVMNLDPLLLKKNPLNFTPNGIIRDTPPAEAGLSPLLNNVNVQC